MSIAETLLPEFDNETTITRKLLERVPSDQAKWKPHPKSFPLGHLAQLVARMPGWTTNALQSTELNLSGASPYSFEKTETLLAEFDKHAREAHEAIAASSDADFKVIWSLKNGDQVLFAAPRLTIVRSNISHLAHHRGQLTVYLRMKDVPLPSIYGPTADERW